MDVWSIGCIFSEISVWAHSGNKMLQEYRRRRENEIRTNQGGGGNYRFHHNSQVLDVVNQIHQNTKERCKVKDRVTKDVLSQLLGDMLQRPDGRGSAKFLHEKCERKITDAVNHFGIDLESIAGSHEQSQNSMQDDPVPRTPPNLPVSDDTLLDGTFRGNRRSVSLPYPQSPVILAEPADYQKDITPSSLPTLGGIQRELSSKTVPLQQRNEFKYPVSIPSDSFGTAYDSNTSPIEPFGANTLSGPARAPTPAPAPQPPIELKGRAPARQVPRPYLSLRQGCTWMQQMKGYKKKKRRWELEPKLPEAETHLALLDRRDHVSCSLGEAREIADINEGHDSRQLNVYEAASR